MTTGMLMGLWTLAGNAVAEVWLPSIFGDHMVVQRDMPITVWGKANAGETVAVSLAEHAATTTADDQGHWKLKLDPLPAGGPHILSVKADEAVTFEDVLVGEVWICSGQSNMAFAVRNSYDGDLEIASAGNPNLRLISVPQVGTQEPQDDFKGEWQVASPESVADFSAVGYFFGSRVQDVVDVPVGLIDNAWGGSSAEAWVKRRTLEADGQYAALLSAHDKASAEFDPEKAQSTYQKQLARWQERVAEARQTGMKLPPRPRAPRDPRIGNHRPANIYNGVLKPTIGYGIRGAIWYQGESNAGRAEQYRDLFPLMIQSWRDEWGQGNFPFYWVQLADFLPETEQPQESAWAELREAQTMAMSQLDNSGQAVIVDVGEGRDIHPRDKRTVANRLARWALANDYGVDLTYRSPQYKSMEKSDGKIVLDIEHAPNGLYTFDVAEPIGFAIAGEDKKFVWAKAKLVESSKPQRIEVWSDEVPDPVAVRYAWSDNPVCNVYDRSGLPLTPFRTDDWKGVTSGVDH